MIIEITPKLFNDKINNAYSEKYHETIFQWYKEQTTNVFEALYLDDKYKNMKISLKENGNICFNFDTNAPLNEIYLDFETIADPDADGNFPVDDYLVTYNNIKYFYKCKSIDPLLLIKANNHIYNYFPFFLQLYYIIYWYHNYSENIFYKIFYY